MRKILLFTIDYSPSTGGVARYLAGMARYFGERMDVVVPRPEARRWWSAASSLVGFWRRYSCVIVSHVLPLGTAAMIAGVFTRVPYVVVVHGMDVGLAKTRWWKRRVAGLVLRRARLVVTNSRALEREVRESFGVARTLVAYPSASSAREEAENAAEKSPEAFRLLTVARLVERKGHMRALEAVRRLREALPGLAISYVIVGDGPMRPQIESSIRSAGLDSAVRVITGASDAELPALYRQADAFVMPVVQNSVDREGFGTVYLEAAAYGVPSVATDMPGVDEAVLDNSTGFLVADGDIAGLTRALYRLATDDALRARLGRAARERALREFTPEIQFKKLSESLSAFLSQ